MNVCPHTLKELYQRYKYKIAYQQIEQLNYGELHIYYPIKFDTKFSYSKLCKIIFGKVGLFYVKIIKGNNFFFITLL